MLGKDVKFRLWILGKGSYPLMGEKSRLEETKLVKIDTKWGILETNLKSRILGGAAGPTQESHC